MFAQEGRDVHLNPDELQAVRAAIRVQRLPATVWGDQNGAVVELHSQGTRMVGVNEGVQAAC